MVEQLATYVPQSANGEIDSLKSYEFGPRQDTPLHLGARAVEFSHSSGVMRPVEQVDNYSRESEMHDDTEDRPSNPEGDHNGELYEQAYDAAIESIESAFEADSLELGHSLAAILASIDVLSSVPYISSAPEFVGLVKAARANVEHVRSYVDSDSRPELNLAVVSAVLTTAKQQLVATTVAYRR